jgi:hypothetical protein
MLGEKKRVKNIDITYRVLTGRAKLLCIKQTIANEIVCTYRVNNYVSLVHLNSVWNANLLLQEKKKEKKKCFFKNVKKRKKNSNNANLCLKKM